MIYAEVIGDPIAHSKSPVIHKYWLSQLGIEGEYLRTRVAADELAICLAERRSDPNWRGCNVTIPHKETIIPLLDRLDPAAEVIGAVNCVVPEGEALAGYNSDIDGVGAALDSTELGGGKIAIIGAGGAARALVAYANRRGVDRIAIVARNPDKAGALRALAPGVDFEILSFDQAELALNGATVIANASPLGMSGADPMPQALLDAVKDHAAGATIFDLVTTPAETEFLAARCCGGGDPVDGLTMLVGQAARAFELFFGAAPPAVDQGLRDLLVDL